MQNRDVRQAEQSAELRHGKSVVKVQRAVGVDEYDRNGFAKQKHRGEHMHQARYPASSSRCVVEGISLFESRTQGLYHGYAASLCRKDIAEKKLISPETETGLKDAIESFNRGWQV